MTTLEEEYKGYVLSWQEPPPTTANWQISIGSNDIDFARLLEQATGNKGTHQIIGADKASALRAANEFVDGLVNNWQ